MPLHWEHWVWPWRSSHGVIDFAQSASDDAWWNGLRGDLLLLPRCRHSGLKSPSGRWGAEETQEERWSVIKKCCFCLRNAASVRWLRVRVTSLWMRGLEAAVVGPGTALKTERRTETHTGTWKRTYTHHQCGRYRHQTSGKLWGKKTQQESMKYKQSVTKVRVKQDWVTRTHLN